MQMSTLIQLNEYNFCFQDIFLLSFQLMRNQGQQLQISEFIKEPSSLKLLILAGTNIRASELVTVAKCISLIKLDLSANGLAHIPIKFNGFTQLKVLFLHDNQLDSIDIKNTTIEYLSLFSNPVKDYRKEIVSENERLIGLDYHMITDQQRHTGIVPPFSKIKWPLVQISTQLENQDDYLNLLKAEIFVINNLHKRTVSIEKIRNFLMIIKEQTNYLFLKKKHDQQKSMKKETIKNLAEVWKKNVTRKQKIRALLSKKNKQYLMFDRIQYKKFKLSPKSRETVGRFIKSVRQIMAARKILEKHINSYKNSIPNQKLLADKLYPQQGKPIKVYFKNKQLYIFQKLCLYLKKLLFKQKKYDLCDNFERIVKPSGKNYILFRQPQCNSDQKSWLMSSIHQSLRLVLRQKNLDRRNRLYDRSGHRAFKIKLNKKYFLDERSMNKCLQINIKLNEKEREYETLVQYIINDKQIFKRLLRLIRFFNAGNQDQIMMNKAAYFQTQVIFDSGKTEQRNYLYFGFEGVMKRVIAANVIQRWWRKKLEVKQSKTRIIEQIKKKRAENVIRRWLKNILFQRRVILSKVHSYQQSICRQTQLYFHLSIYMNIPHPKNFIRKQNLSIRDLYQVIHTGSQIQIVESFGRKWIRVKFVNSKQAFKAIREIGYLTYRYYYNGFCLKFFSSQEIRNEELLRDYQSKVKHLYSIQVPYQKSDSKICKSLWIQNPDPFFIWPELEKNLGEFFEAEMHSFPINMFIYNKHRRPLKVNCQLKWVNPDSVYKNKKKNRILVRSAQKMAVQQTIQDKREMLQFYLPHIKHHRQKRHSIGTGQHTSLLKSSRKRGHSQITNLKLLSETMSLNRK